MKLIDRLKSAHSFHGDPLHRDAWERIEELEMALEKYDCAHNCTEPCALYWWEEKVENDMPHMICGWWATRVLKDKTNEK